MYESNNGEVQRERKSDYLGKGKVEEEKLRNITTLSRSLLQMEQRDRTVAGKRSTVKCV